MIKPIVSHLTTFILGVLVTLCAIGSFLYVESLFMKGQARLMAETARESRRKADESRRVAERQLKAAETLLDSR